MLYKLENIEIWIYKKNNYPDISYKKEIDALYKNKKYSFEEFKLIEKDLKKVLDRDYKVIDIMNPLYLIWGVTTISIDATPKKYIKYFKNCFLKNNHPHPFKSDKEYKTLLDLLKRRDKKIKTTLSSGKGSMKLKNINGALFSEDKELFEIEKHISNLIKNKINFITNEKKCNVKFLEALQWVPKNSDILNFYFNKLKSGSPKEKNIILKQIIPIISNLSDKQKIKLGNLLINEILLYPTSSIRNKGLTIISEILDMKLSYSKSFVNLINKIAKSTQYNCSYPAQEIKKSLNL